MKNPFEKMFRDNYKNPRPETNEGEFTETNETAEQQLLEAAKMEAEGIILYAPLPQEVKEMFLAQISQIADKDILELKQLLKDPRGSSAAQCAGLVVHRALRGTLDQVKTMIAPREHQLLTFAIDGLYCEPSVFNDAAKEWLRGTKH